GGERTVDGDALGDVEEGASGPGGERAAPERHLGRERVLLADVRPHQVAVLADGRCQVSEDHAAIRELRIELICRKRRVQQQAAVARQIIERGAAPLLFGAGRPGVSLYPAPPLGAQPRKPGGLVAEGRYAEPRGAL